MRSPAKWMRVSHRGQGEVIVLGGKKSQSEKLCNREPIYQQSLFDRQVQELKEQYETREFLPFSQ